MKYKFRIMKDNGKVAMNNIIRYMLIIKDSLNNKLIGKFIIKIIARIKERILIIIVKIIQININHFLIFFIRFKSSLKI
jgi:hypothetical protein